MWSGKDKYLKALFLVVIFSPVIMLFVDVFHEVPDKILRFITRGAFQDTYFSGPDWFSAIATLITAIPASILGLFALQQTERLHKLEDRYHRPMLAVHSGMIEEVWVNNSSYKEKDYLEFPYTTNTYMQSIANGALGGCSCLKEFVKIRLQIAVTNQVPVTNMHVKSMKFKLNNREWKLKLIGQHDDNHTRAIDSFGTDVLDGQYIVVLETALHPFELAEKPDNVEESDFTDELFKFMRCEQTRAYGYDRMGITIEMSTEYEFGNDGAQNLECHMMWKSEKGKTENYGAISRCTTANGYFKYVG